MEFTEENFNEFLAKIFNKSLTTPKNEIKITEVEWRTNVHAYYLFDKSKANVSILRQLNSLNPVYSKAFDDFAERINKICKKAHERKVYLHL